jgi:hypothetical protein
MASLHLIAPVIRVAAVPEVTIRYCTAVVPSDHATTRPQYRKQPCGHLRAHPAWRHCRAKVTTSAQATCKDCGTARRPEATMQSGCSRVSTAPVISLPPEQAVSARRDARHTTGVAFLAPYSSTTSTSSRRSTASSRRGGSPTSPGIDLLQEATGGQPVSDDYDYRSFLRELEMACDCGFLTFTVLHHREVTGCERRGFGSA